MSTPTESNKQRKARGAQAYLRGQEQQEKGKLKSGFRLLLRAAKLGDPGAQHSLGYTYDIGMGIRRNPKAAMHWYKKAYRSQRGWGISASNIAMILRDEQNYREAIRWFRRAVRYGDIDANLDLAKIYLRHSRQERKAITCLKAILKASPPTGVGEDTQREARKLLKRMEGRNPIELRRKNQ